MILEYFNGFQLMHLASGPLPTFSQESLEYMSDSIYETTGRLNQNVLISIFYGIVSVVYILMARRK